MEPTPTIKGGNSLAFGLDTQSLCYYAGIALVLVGVLYVPSLISGSKKETSGAPGSFKSFLLFFWTSFVKPHQGTSKGTQQDALESFYKTQAGAYDVTRKVLLRGREDMLALVAAQLQSKAALNATAGKAPKSIWVDARLPNFRPSQSVPC